MTDENEGVKNGGPRTELYRGVRDELTNLFPNNEKARLLNGQMYLLSEFLKKEDYRPMRPARRSGAGDGIRTNRRCYGLNREENGRLTTV